MPHDIEWTPEKIERFWNDYSANEALADTYFAGQVGHSIVSFVAKRIRIGRAVDIGCGRGDLIGHLLASGHFAGGTDQSPESVATVQRRFTGNPLFTGAGPDLPKQSADTAFILEVVEHMDDAALDRALARARTALKPGGHIVVTTPNEEELARAQIVCPDCGCRFHKMQHVRNWSAQPLTERMAKAGFGRVVCEPTLFSAHRGPKARLDRLRWRGRKLPHLVYVGRKRA